MNTSLVAYMNREYISHCQPDVLQPNNTKYMEQINLRLSYSSSFSWVSSCAHSQFSSMSFPKGSIKPQVGRAWTPRAAPPMAVDAAQSKTFWPPPHRSAEIVMPGPFHRRMFVFNCRNSDGRTRTTALTFTTAKHRPLMYLTRQDFDALVAASEEIKLALVDFQKKL